MRTLSPYDVLANTRRRTAQFASTLTKLLDSDFPYDDSKQAASGLLQGFEIYVNEAFETVDTLGNEASKRFIVPACLSVVRKIRQLHPVAGFILRSTNTRNAFEIFDPLKRIVEQFIEPNLNLVLSSEWDYTPFAIPFAVRELPTTVFIGLPAVESGNALFIPLTGHELGHAYWRRKKVDGQYRARVAEILDKNLEGSKAKSKRKMTEKLKVGDTTSQYALAQLEELFADFVGLLLFGEAYLHAYFYVLSPGVNDHRSPHYPPLRKRTQYLCEAASEIGVTVKQPEEGLLTEGELPPGVTASLVEQADNAVHLLWREVFVAAQKSVPAELRWKSDHALQSKVVKAFRRGQPSNAAQTLADVVNAAWDVYSDAADTSLVGIMSAPEIKTLDEVAYKTLEVIEYGLRIQEGGGPHLDDTQQR